MTADVFYSFILLQYPLRIRFMVNPKPIPGTLGTRQGHSHICNLIPTEGQFLVFSKSSSMDLDSRRKPTNVWGESMRRTCKMVFRIEPWTWSCEDTLNYPHSPFHWRLRSDSDWSEIVWGLACGWLIHSQSTAPIVDWSSFRHKRHPNSIRLHLCSTIS